MLNFALIGCGYWGPNYARILNELKETNLVCCCDIDEMKLNKMKNLYPSVLFDKNYKDIAKRDDIDAIIITTPLNTHYEIAKEFLKNGKHVLVEKPFTKTIREGEKLKTIAEKKKLTLMVGHVYLYNPGIIRLKNEMKNLGELYYIFAERMGLGPIRKQANALWDLAIHDIYILLYLLEEFPKKVVAIGGAYIQKNIEDIVHLTLRFPSGIIGNINVSWLAPEKIRKLTLVGERRMVIFDDVNKSEMIKIYERGVDKKLLDSTPEYTDHQLIVKVGDVYIPKIEQSEPLKNQVKHFIRCIEKNEKPLSDAENGINVLKILIKAEKSLKRGSVCR